MSEILDTYAAEAEARRWRDMAATELLLQLGYVWRNFKWQKAEDAP